MAQTTTPPPAAGPNPAHVAHLLDQLKKHLDAEIAVQRRLLALEESMSPRLLAGDVQGFARLTAEGEEPTREAARLKAVRERIAQALAAVFKLNPGEVHLSKVLPYAPEHLRAELESRRQELVRICERLRRITDRNLAVVRQGLTLVRDILGEAFGTPAAVPVYDRRGISSSGLTGGGRMLNIRG
jgi:hypothetical protein